MRANRLLVSLLFLGANVAAASTARSQSPTVVVLPPEFGVAVSEGARASTSQWLVAGLTAARFVVRTEADVRKHLGREPSCETRECLTRVARQLGANYLVRATLDQHDNSYTLDLRLVRGATGEIAAQMRDRCDICGLEEVGERVSLAASALRARLEAYAVGPARLAVRSTPAGATVELDGRSLGRAPLEREVPPGSHTLRLRHDGYASVERTLALVADVSENVDATLIRKPSAPALVRHTLLASAKVGGIFPVNELGPGPAAQVGLGYAPPVLKGRLAVVLDLGYSQGSKKSTLTDARLAMPTTEYATSLTQRDLGLFLGPQIFILDPRGRYVPYLAAGVDLHFLETAVSARSGGVPFGENKETSTVVGFAARAGFGYRLGPGLIVAELGYSWAPVTQDVTGTSSRGGVSLLVGYTATIGLGR
jgi:hypothetical protein